MCNLYRMTKGVDEIARLFAVEPDQGANFAGELYPGYPGLVVAEGTARAMNWGFPVVLTGKQVRFRVTAPEGRRLEHDGTFGADGSIEGMVNMDNQPIAKFKIAPRKDSKSLPKK